MTLYVTPSVEAARDHMSEGLFKHMYPVSFNSKREAAVAEHCYYCIILFYKAKRTVDGRLLVISCFLASSRNLNKGDFIT